MNDYQGNNGYNNGSQNGYNAPQGQGGYNAPQGQGGYNAPQGQGGYNAPQGQGGYNAPQGQGGYNAPQGQGGYNAPQGQGGYNAPQGQGGYNAPQGQGGYNAPQGQGNGGSGRTRYPSSALIYRPSYRNENNDWVYAPLDQAVMAVAIQPGQDSDNLSVNYSVKDNGKPMLRLNFNLKLGKNTIADVFGQEFVREDATVDFSIFMNGNIDRFLSNPPKRTQYLLIQVTGMKVNRYTSNKDGSEHLSITGNCFGYQKIGSTKRKDGTESQNITIFGAENAQQPQGGYAAPQQGSYGAPYAGNYGGSAPQQGGYGVPNGYGPTQTPGVSGFQELNDDDELPF